MQITRLSFCSYTREYTGDSTDLVYLRARYYDPNVGRLLSKDTWAGQDSLPLSFNRWNYGYGNPVKYTDPSGHYPACPIRDWDCEAVRNVWKLKNTFLESASRHNLILGMDNNGFAALLASVVVGERRLGNVPLSSDPRNRNVQRLENLVADFGCIVSGHFIKDAWDARDWSQLWRYLTNQDVPQLATIGIGNVWLYTATNIWNGQACSPALGGECTPVEVNKLQVTNIFGGTVDISNPYGSQVACTTGLGGACAPGYTPTETESLIHLEQQLTSNKINIEYVAANLEAGERRAIAKGFQPTAFNIASWHLWGVQSNDEINQVGWNPGGAIWTLDHLSNALDAMEITTTWNLQMDPQYVYWKNR